MSSVLFLDFETRSAIDIRKSGADAYARHPSTDILCMGYAFDDGPVELWKPSDGPVPIDIEMAVLDPDTKFVAHNAPFEIAIWNYCVFWRYGVQPLTPGRFDCTMAMSYAMALPGALADAAPALGLPIQKDDKGHRIMLQLSQPRKVIENACFNCSVGDGVRDSGCTECFGSGHAFEWYTRESHPDKFDALYNYCRQDIEVERQLFKRLLRLTDRERAVWLLDYRINQRGVKVDLEAVETAIALVNAEKKRLDARMREVTGGAVATCTATGQLTDWLRSKGVQCEGVAKADVVDLLSESSILPDVRDALLLRQEAAKSSTAKLEAMVRGVCEDGRLRGMFQYWGAGATGRWAGRRVQLQNLPRPTFSQEEIDGVFEILEGVG
jgi:DNA polymerase bacteriophage-type